MLRVDDEELPVVSGGAHWGGGLWVNAADLALIGELYRRRDRWNDRQLISDTWIEMSWAPSAVKPDYGLLWWRNDLRTVFPAAPATGRAARGNLGRHLLWVDPARNLIIASHWGDDVETLLHDVSAQLTS